MNQASFEKKIHSTIKKYIPVKKVNKSTSPQITHTHIQKIFARQRRKMRPIKPI